MNPECSQDDGPRPGDLGGGSLGRRRAGQGASWSRQVQEGRNVLAFSYFHLG